MVTREAIIAAARGWLGIPPHFGGLGLAALGVKVDDAKATKIAGTKPAKAK